MVKHQNACPVLKAQFLNTLVQKSDVLRPPSFVVGFGHCRKVPLSRDHQPDDQPAPGRDGKQKEVMKEAVINMMNVKRPDRPPFAVANRPTQSFFKGKVFHPIKLC